MLRDIQSRLLTPEGPGVAGAGLSVLKLWLVSCSSSFSWGGGLVGLCRLAVNTVISILSVCFTSTLFEPSSLRK